MNNGFEFVPELPRILKIPVEKSFIVVKFCIAGFGLACISQLSL